MANKSKVVAEIERQYNSDVKKARDQYSTRVNAVVEEYKYILEVANLAYREAIGPTVRIAESKLEEDTLKALRVYTEARREAEMGEE